MRSRRATWLVLPLLAGVVALAQESPGVSGEVSEARARSVHPEAEAAARRIRCDCGCPPQTAWECACGHAAGMVRDMDREAQAGRTADQIVEGYLEREGVGILISPPMQGWNLTAWYGPTLGLVLASGILVAALVAWRRRGQEARAPAASPAAGPVPDDPYRQRALRELRETEGGPLR